MRRPSAGTTHNTGTRRGNLRRKQLDWHSIVFQAILLLPAVAFLAVFLFYPIVETFRTSMMRTSALGSADYIGFQNYTRLFADEEFQTGFRNVLAWAFWSVVIQIPLAFYIAFTLTTYKDKLSGVLRAVYYLASVMPSAITAMLGKFIFAPKFGVISSLADRLNWKWLASIISWAIPILCFGLCSQSPLGRISASASSTLWPISSKYQVKFGKALNWTGRTCGRMPFILPSRWFPTRFGFWLLSAQSEV